MGFYRWVLDRSFSSLRWSMWIHVPLLRKIGYYMSALQNDILVNFFPGGYILSVLLFLISCSYPNVVDSSVLLNWFMQIRYQQTS